MAGPPDIDDDMQRRVLRKVEATAKGGHAFQRLQQLAETRDSGQSDLHSLIRRRPAGEGGDRAMGLKWPEAQ